MQHPAGERRFVFAPHGTAANGVSHTRDGRYWLATLGLCGFAGERIGGAPQAFRMNLKPRVR